jgi:hypothetical protein
MRWIVPVSLVAALCRPAGAEDRVKAEEAYHAATLHYNLGEYKEALEGFKDAYRSYENPIFLFNIAQCHRQLGDKAHAIRFYRVYLNSMPEASNRDQVHEMIVKLEKQLADEQAAQSGPPQGTLSPNAERPAETTPPGESSARRLSPTPSELGTGPAPPPPSASSPSPPPPSPPPVTSPSPSPPEAAAPAAVVAEPVAPAPAPSPPIYKRWWLWTAVGAVVVVGVGVGVGVGVSRAAPATPTAKTDFGTFRF